MKILAFTACASMALAGAAMGDDLAYWAFNTNDLPGGGFGYQPGDFPLGADFGLQAGSATVGVFGGLTGDTVVNGNGDTVFQWIQSFAGSSGNVQFGEGSGGSLAVQGGTGGGNNGAYIELAFDSSLHQDIMFSFDYQSTSTGFDSVSIDAFDGGSILGNINTIMNDGSVSFTTLSFSTSLLDGVADARIRLTLDGATSPTGNNRFDNFYVQGTLIPAPGPAAMGLTGLAVVGMRRRRA